MEKLEVQGQSTAVVMDVSLTAKGLAQWEVKVTFPNVADATKNLDTAIKNVRKVINDNLLKETGV